MTNQDSNRRAWAAGGVVFAATMMIMLGIWQVFVGIAALAEDELFVITGAYTYEINTTVWGLVHLILGAVILIAGLAVFTGAAWARAVGIMLAVLLAVANFLFLPYYPLWSIITIAVSVFVIWALATTGSRLPADEPVAPAAPAAPESSEYDERGRHLYRNGSAGTRSAAPGGAGVQTGTSRARP